MIVSIGVDVVEIERLEAVFERRGDRFRMRVFTDGEIGFCDSRSGPSRFASYAARFAAKEAVMKALGTGWADGVGWKEIEVVCDPSGAPRIELNGHAVARFREIGASRIHVSLSHSGNIAIAQVVLEA